jgi:hypothetical protein
MIDRQIDKKVDKHTTRRNVNIVPYKNLYLNVSGNIIITAKIWKRHKYPSIN